MGKWNKGTIATTCQNLDKLRIPISGTERSSIQGDIPYYGANGQVGYIDDFIFDEPLILIAEDGGNFEQYETRPIAYRINGKSWVNNHAHILRALPAYDQDYIFYSLEHKNVLYYIAGGTRSKLTQKELSKIEIVYPEDIKEQRKIAQILTTLDEAISKTKAIIEKYKAIKEGLMQDLLANGIDENGVIRSPKTHKYKDSPLGKIPVEWECVPFETVIEKLYDYRGRTPKKLGMEWGGDIPALSASNVCMGEIDFNKQTNFGSEKLYRKWMSQGDIHKDYIAFTMEAPLGNVALVPEERKYILSQRTIVFNCKQDICKNRYLYYYLASDSFQSYLQKYNSGTTAKGIQRKQLYKMFIVYPSKTREQEDIYRALEHIDSCLANAKKHLIKHQAIKTGLMQDLLTHKVSVEPLLERSVENE
ncbi:MAG: restriction endonuclease subunit S [Clostridia bacterium]|nr:restriction endonuclease subunit S [Clostridia bacterium]